MSQLKIGLRVVVVAGAAAIILLGYQTQRKLRSENESLRQQIAQLKSESQDTSAANANPTMGEDFDELLRLRGEVGVLRSQTNQLQEQNQQLQEALVTAAQKPRSAADPNAIHPYAYFILQNKIAHLGVMGMLKYAADHTNNLPASFDQAASYYGSDPLKTNLNGFEITYWGPLTNIVNPSNAVIVQSIHPWRTTNTQAKAYGFADGHAETHGVGIFDEWELKHVPVLKGQ